MEKVMDQENLQGKVQEGMGTVKEKVGRTVDDPTMVAEGRNDQDEGRMHEALGTVREKVGDAAGMVKDKAEVLSERIRDAAQRVTHRSDDTTRSDTSKP
jgi:uncharacterized protein YjbJ (UPF0337 family)